ncbi:Carboxypeptidase SOL1 [Citrus sinensis]|nr:Carboxypeptidase SOL1 [Citrus sinensis]KAH9691890.1 Carboxypeptidase SOL1 [Citrus sinensis]
MTFLIQKDKEGCSTGHLFEGNPSETSFDKAKGHVTNAELEKAVKEFRQRCSNISRICCFIILAVLLPVWSAREFFLFSSKKFIGNVHADEPVGRELLILLANWICNNHMKDPLVRLIAENMHLHIFPSMNPDGYALKRLGALVANYPWDGTQDKRRYYYGCLDDEAFGFLASVYSCSHYYMSLSTEFQGGIMNGALVEISGDKWPSSDELPTIWEYNKMSMLNLVASLVKVNAGRAVADHYRLLTPGKRYEVMASMPGYKPKSTIIWLEETATADFIPRYHTRG